MIHYAFNLLSMLDCICFAHLASGVGKARTFNIILSFYRRGNGSERQVKYPVSRCSGQSPMVCDAELRVLSQLWRDGLG